LAAKNHAAEPSAPVENPVLSARSAGLRYVSDGHPGISRRRNGSAKAFGYVDARGKKVLDPDVLLRIRQLVIPPAWKDVWISPDEHGHIQAVGWDQRGRKQYRYHPRWREVRDEAKYEKIIAFVHALPRLRARVKRDLAKQGLPREKVLATVVRLLETTLIRVGNDEYASSNGSFGLTTLRDHHAKIVGSRVRFRFNGKSGVRHEIDVDEPHLAKVVRRCQELPGEELLQYVDDGGEVRDVSSGDVNNYLREITGQEFTAKDFRTWAGTVLAARALQEFEQVDSQAKRKKNIVAAIESVAKKLGNTRAVCKKCYIHPDVLNSYLDGSMLRTLRQRARKLDKRLGRLRPEEAAILVLLQSRLARESRGQRKRRKRPQKLRVS
jgi:DNA topoisomerase-1